MSEEFHTKLVREIERQLIADGKIIEAGWMGLRYLSIPKEASEIQLTEMRQAFFAGAHHVFTTIMSVMDEGEEPTEADLARMTQISNELDNFFVIFKRRHNLA